MRLGRQAIKSNLKLQHFFILVTGVVFLLGGGRFFGGCSSDPQERHALEATPTSVIDARADHALRNFEYSKGSSDGSSRFV